ncbi:MAG: HAMP domain-containing sensor histidine kinase [Flavobacterium sp.]|nr:HAMP domain-containing sensor histidine kinase [Flavobacterium sp.]
MTQSLRTPFALNKRLLITALCLYVASILLTAFLIYNAAPKQVVKQLEAKLAKHEAAFGKIYYDTALLLLLTKDTLTPNISELQKLPFGLFVNVLNDVGHPILTYWNSNQYYLPNQNLPQLDGSFFITNQNGNFEVVKKTVRIKAQTVLIYAVIPIRWHYFIENKYLHTNFDAFSDLDAQYDISNDTGTYTVKNSNGQAIFKITPKQSDNFITYDFVTVLLRTLAILFLFIALNVFSLQLVKNKGFATGFTFFVFTVFTFRLLTYFLPFPFQYSKLGLFDPSVYASSKLHPSLGHLLINSVLVFWLIFFYKFNNPNHKQLPTKLAVYINLILLLAITLYVANVITSLVSDSKISFDVTNFFSLNIYSIVSFFILGYLALAYYHLSHILLKPVVRYQLPVWQQLLIVLVAGFLYLTFTLVSNKTPMYLAVLAWLLFYIVLVNWRSSDIHLPLLKSSFFIFWMMWLAASCTVLVSLQNKVVEWEQRKKMAERLAYQSDPNGENLLAIAMANFDNKSLAKNFHRFHSEFANKFLKDSLLGQNFSGYLNKFDTRIYTFDSLYHPLYNDDSATYAILKTIAVTKGKTGIMPDLYTYQNTDDQANYLYEKIIEDKGVKLGYFFVVVKPKRYKSEALYPELFNQVQDLNIDLNTNYAYAVYINGKIVNKLNDYNFPTQISSKTLTPFEYKKITTTDYTELWYNAGNAKSIIIARQDAGLIEVATLFAYLFFTFLILVVCFHTGSYLLRTDFSKLTFSQLLQTNIRTQIHTTIIFVSLFSFVVVGVATISFFINRFNKTNEARLSKTIQLIGNEIEGKVKEIHTQLFLDDVLTLYDVGYVNDLERKITEVSEVYNVDINLFTANGSLKATTQPYIYNKSLLSYQMNPTAFDALHYNNASRFIQSEYIGNLKYTSIYIPIFDEDDRAFGYINIPYLNSQIELTQEISNFIATLINLNAFVFLLAGAIAFLLTERIVSAFKAIADKMQQVNLSQHNEVITWHRNDEIAPLVNEYNAMVQKLEQSAVALARSEREGAWREMARQVAHEIKNPLTPMKLSIQYLLRAIDADAANSKELAKKVATTLVEQIGQLAKIAGDFSQFANINNVQLETFDVAEVLSSVIALYHHSEGVTIHYQHTIASLVTADKTHLNRLFTNLIKNAIEAVNDEAEASKTIITIVQQQQAKAVVISITDNGNGIPEAMQSRIFTPNFTTKTSGTGLGLAICKGIVENINGTIQFSTQANVGSTFTITLPLANTNLL